MLAKHNLELLCISKFDEGDKLTPSKDFLTGRSKYYLGRIIFQPQ